MSLGPKQSGRADRNVATGSICGVYGKWDHPLKPRLTLACARGSGNFRQTDLLSNEGSLGQEIETFYYGEVLRPELANLTVLTMGAGVTFGDKLSADLYWRDYRLGGGGQGLRGSALRVDPASGGTWGAD